MAGLLRLKSGSIRFGEYRIDLLSVTERARCGIAFVPQEANIFQTLSVRAELTDARPTVAPFALWQARGCQHIGRSGYDPATR